MKTQTNCIEDLAATAEISGALASTAMVTGSTKQDAVAEPNSTSNSKN